MNLYCGQNTDWKITIPKRINCWSLFLAEIWIIYEFTLWPKCRIENKINCLSVLHDCGVMVKHKDFTLGQQNIHHRYNTLLWKAVDRAHHTFGMRSQTKWLLILCITYRPNRKHFSIKGGIFDCVYHWYLFIGKLNISTLLVEREQYRMVYYYHNHH